MNLGEIQKFRVLFRKIGPLMLNQLFYEQIKINFCYAHTIFLIF